MLELIYASMALQVFILVIVFYLVLQRWALNLFKRYVKWREHRFEPHVLNLLNEPTATAPLEHDLLPYDKKFIMGLLLQQAAQLKGEDRHNITTIFEKLGYVKSEMSALRSKRWWRRLEAAINLGTIQSRDALSVLIDAVKDPNEDIRLAAVRALGKLNEPRGLQVLLDVMEEGVRWTRSSIVEVLVGMGPDVASEIVPRLESTMNLSVRLLYVQLCGLLQITAALGSLFLLLNDRDKETRVLAAQALGNIGDTAAVESLIVSLDDESWEVKAEAAKALGTLGDERAVNKLKQLLSDENWWIRHNTANSLYQLGETGIAVLRQASCSDEAAPRAVAAQVLAERALGV